MLFRSPGNAVNSDSTNGEAASVPPSVGDGFDVPTAALAPMDEHLQAIGRVIDSPLPKEVKLPAGLVLPPGMRVVNASQSEGRDGELAATIVGWTTMSPAETVLWFEQQARSDGWSLETRPAAEGGASQTLLLEKSSRRRIVTIQGRLQGQGSLVGINLLE